MPIHASLSATQLGQFPCSFTWTAAGTAYVYVRSLADAPPPLLAAFLSMPEAPAQQGNGEEEQEDVERAPGGVAWLPSTCTVAVVPGDLMV